MEFHEFPKSLYKGGSDWHDTRVVCDQAEQDAAAQDGYLPHGAEPADAKPAGKRRTKADDTDLV